MAKDFGYTVSRDRQIDFDKLSRKFYLEVVKAEPSVVACISCGSCAATCSAGQYTDFSLRRFILMLRRGMDQEVMQSIDKCMLCGKCQLVCPMGVNTRGVIYSIQSIIHKQREASLYLVTSSQDSSSVQQQPANLSQKHMANASF